MKNARASVVSFTFNFLLVVSAASAAVAPDAVWRRELSRWMDGAAIFMTPDGNVAAAGTYTTGNDMYPRVWKHSPAGALLWSVSPPGVICPLGGVAGAGVDASGAVITACTDKEAGTSNHTKDGVVFKVNAAGSLAWAKPWTVTRGDKTVTGIAVAPSGEAYVCGILDDWESGPDLLLVKFDGEGNVLWERRYDGPVAWDHEGATAVALMPGGGAVVTGFSYVTTPLNILTICYEANGNARWLKTTPGERGIAVIADAAGNVTAGGRTGDPNSTAAQAIVVHYDTSGNEAWIYRQGVTPPAVGGTELVSLAHDGTGRIAAACRTRDRSPQTPVIPGKRIDTLTALTSAGAVEWTATFPEYEDAGSRFPDFEYEGLYALTGLPAGGFIAGGGWRDGHRVLGKVSGAGVLEWVKTAPVAAVRPVRIIRRATIDAAGNIYTLGDTDDLILERHGSATVPGEPQAATLAADELAWNSARLNGTVNPAGFAATAHFIYGPSTSYGFATAPQNIPAGMADVPFSAMATGLKGDTTYHFRLVAKGAAATVTADDLTFTTPRSPYQNWAAEKMGSHTAPGTAPDEDFDHDGTSNFLEQAFGGDPAAPGPVAGLPVPEMYRSPASGVLYFSIVWEESLAATGVTFTPEAATNLAAWTGPVPALGNITIQTLPPGNRKRAIASNFQKFLRLRVAQTP